MVSVMTGGQIRKSMTRLVLTFFILDVEVELLQVCEPLLMVVIMQFSLSLHELQWLMISVDDYLLPKNVIPPLAA
jgi:hypothetical protein